MRFGRAFRLPLLIVVLGFSSAAASMILPARLVTSMWLSIASVIIIALGFLFKQLATFENASDTPGLDSTEIWAIDQASTIRQRHIKLLLFGGLVITGIMTVPFAADLAGYGIRHSPFLGLFFGCLLAIAVNCVFVYFDWRRDLLRMRQIAKQRSLQRSEADKALQQFTNQTSPKFGDFDGFRKL